MKNEKNRKHENGCLAVVETNPTTFWSVTRDFQKAGYLSSGDVVIVLSETQRFSERDTGILMRRVICNHGIVWVANDLLVSK